MATALGICLAVLSACANATVNVTQRSVSRRVAQGVSFSPRLIRELLRNPLWCFGLALSTLTFGLQAVAMGLAPLAIVQPILIIELPLTLIGATHFLGGRLSATEWGAVAAMTVGLAVLLAFLRPQGDSYQAATPIWILSTSLSAAVIVVVTVAARVHRGVARTALLGCATGLCFGLSAAFMKEMAGAFSAAGITAALATWQTYAAIATGAIGTWLYQTSLHAGPLVLAQPGITLLDPVLAIVFGLFVFGERVTAGPTLLVAALGGLLMAAGVVMLGRCEALHVHPGPARAPAVEVS